MCFGVRDALAAAHEVASRRPATILGQLVHNEVVRPRLSEAGAREGRLEAQQAGTADVIVTLTERQTVTVNGGRARGTG